MSSLAWLDWIIVALVPLTCLALGLGTRRPNPKDWVDYFLAKGALSTQGQLSNYIGANLVFTAVFLVLSLEATRRGWWVLAVPVSWMFGTALLIWLYPRLRPYLEKGQTLHQALGSAFDGGQTGWRTVRRWTSLWTIAAFVSGVSLEFYGGILLLQWSGLGRFGSLGAALLLAFICAVFTVVGGLRGVSRVNFFLDSTSVTGILTLFAYILYTALWKSAPVRATNNLLSSSYPLASLGDNITFVIAAFLIFAPMQICALDTWQRGVAWKQKQRQSIRWPLILGSLCIFFAASVAIIAGNYVRDHNLIPPEGTHPLFALLTALAIPRIVVGLIVAGFVATILATADELLTCCGYAFLADFLNLPRVNDNQEVTNQYIKSGRFYTGLFAFVAAFMAVTTLRMHRQINDLANVAFATQVVFVLPITVMFFLKEVKRFQKVALLTMLVAFSTAALSTFAGWMMGSAGRGLVEGAPILAFLVSAVVMVVGLWVSRRVRSRRSDLKVHD